MRLRIVKKAEEQKKPIEFDFSSDVVNRVSLYAGLC